MIILKFKLANNNHIFIEGNVYICISVYAQMLQDYEVNTLAYLSLLIISFYLNGDISSIFFDMNI